MVGRTSKQSTLHLVVWKATLQGWKAEAAVSTAGNAIADMARQVSSPVKQHQKGLLIMPRAAAHEIHSISWCCAAAALTCAAPVIMFFT